MKKIKEKKFMKKIAKRSFLSVLWTRDDIEDALERNGEPVSEELVDAILADPSFKQKMDNLMEQYISSTQEFLDDYIQNMIPKEGDPDV